MALKFFWRCESATLVNNGTDDFWATGGDNTATAGGTNSGLLSYSATAKRIGTNGLQIPDGSCWAKFDYANLISPTEGAVAFSFYITTWSQFDAGVPLWKFNGDTADSGDDYLTVWIQGASAGSGNAYFRTKSTDGNNPAAISTTSAGINTGTWYAVIARWKHATNQRRVEVYNSSGTLLGSAGYDGSTTWDDMVLTGTPYVAFGEASGAGIADVYIDNCFIADTYGEAIESENKLAITAYSYYAPSTPATMTLDIVHV